MIQDINVTLNVDKGNIVDNILINNEQLRKVLREAKKEANDRIIEGEEGSYSGEYGSKGSDIVYKEHGFGTTVLEEKLRMGTANLGVSSDQENEKGGTNVTNTQHNTALGKMLVKKQLEILDRRLGLVSKMASAPNEGLGKKANNEKPNEQEEIKVAYRYDSETVDRIKNLGISEMFSGKEPNHGIEDIRVPKEISEDVNLTQGTRTKRVTINTEHGKYKKGANRLVEGRRGVSEFRNEKRRRAIERGARDRLRGVLKKLKKELSETKKQAAKHKEKNAIDHMVLVVSVLVFAMFIGYPIINDYHTGEKRYEAVIVKGINGENEVGGLFFMWWMVLMFGMGGMIVALVGFVVYSVTILNWSKENFGVDVKRYERQQQQGPGEHVVDIAEGMNEGLYWNLFTVTVRSVTPQVLCDLFFGPKRQKREEAKLKCERQFYVTSGKQFLLHKIHACLQFLNSAENDRAEVYALSALHTSQGYSRTVTFQLWRLAKLFAQHNEDVHSSIMLQPLSVQILMKSREWKRLAQSLTLESLHLLHINTGMLQLDGCYKKGTNFSGFIKPQHVFSEFVVLRLLQTIIDNFLDKGMSCAVEMKNLQLIVERAKLSPLIHWYVVVMILLDLSHRTHSCPTYWLTVEKALFSRISIFNNATNMLSRSRAKQLLLLRDILLITFQTPAKYPNVDCGFDGSKVTPQNNTPPSDNTQTTGKPNSVADGYNRALLSYLSKKDVDVVTAQHFKLGRSRSITMSGNDSFDYKLVQCIDVLLEIADEIEKRILFIAMNLLLERRYNSHLAYISYPYNGQLTGKSDTSVVIRLLLIHISILKLDATALLTDKRLSEYLSLYQNMSLNLYLDK